MKQTSQRSLLFRQNVNRTEAEWVHFLDGYRKALIEFDMKKFGDDWHTAEDIVEEIFLNIVLAPRITALRPQDSFRHVLINMCMQKHKSFTKPWRRRLAERLSVARRRRVVDSRGSCVCRAAESRTSAARRRVRAFPQPRDVELPRRPRRCCEARFRRQCAHVLLLRVFVGAWRRYGVRNGPLRLRVADEERAWQDRRLFVALELHKPQPNWLHGDDERGGERSQKRLAPEVRAKLDALKAARPDATFVENVTPEDITAEAIAARAAKAGVHLLTAPNAANVCSAEGIVLVQALKDGPLEIDFGKGGAVHDALTGAFVCNGPKAVLPFRLGQTRLFKTANKCEMTE